MNDGLKGFPKAPSLTGPLSKLHGTAGGGAGGSGGSTSGGATNEGLGQLKGTATERFSVGDLVFQDWKTSEYKNLSATPTAAALAAGPQVTPFVISDLAYTEAQTCAGNGLVLGDGSLVMVAGTHAIVGSDTWSMSTVTRYSAKGDLLYKTRLIDASKITGNVVSRVVMTLLSNGNLAVVLAGRWFLLTPLLEVIASGSAVISTTVFHIQPTNNGGFILFYSYGIDTVSSSGEQVRHLNLNSSSCQPARSDELNSNQSLSDVPQSPYIENLAPANISNGGFGYLYWVGGNISYFQMNADGSKRAAPIVLAAFVPSPTEYFKYAVASGGNIGFAVSGTDVVSVYGVISDAGVLLKSATAVPRAVARSAVYMVSDASGGFSLVGSSSAPNTQGNLYLRQLTALGADVGGAEKNLGVATSIDVTKVLKLSTGTVVIWSGVQGEYTYLYAFVTTAGVIKSAGTLFKFGGGFNGIDSGVMIKDDCVYGAVTGGGQRESGIPEVVPFSIDNAGLLTTRPYYPVITVGVTGLLSIRLVLDYTQRYLYVLYTRGPTATMLTVELSTLRVIQTYAPGIRFHSARIRAWGQAILMLDPDRQLVPATVPAVMGVAIKPQSTVLLGVCANTVEPGGSLTYSTKGMVPVSDTWKGIVYAFDQSKNAPPGNAGNLNNGVINLKGF